MGYSSPKTPFNLADFLNQKAPRNRTRRPNAWIKATGMPAPQQDQPEAETPAVDSKTTPTK